MDFFKQVGAAKQMAETMNGMGKMPSMGEAMAAIPEIVNEVKACRAELAQLTALLQKAFPAVLDLSAKLTLMDSRMDEIELDLMGLKGKTEHD